MTWVEARGASTIPSSVRAEASHSSWPVGCCSWEECVSREIARRRDESPQDKLSRPRSCGQAKSLIHQDVYAISRITQHYRDNASEHYASRYCSRWFMSASCATSHNWHFHQLFPLAERHLKPNQRRLQAHPWLSTTVASETAAESKMPDSKAASHRASVTNTGIYPIVRPTCHVRESFTSSAARTVLVLL